MKGVPPQVMNSYEIGKAAEEWVISYLQTQEYKILARNFRSHCGEIDIVAQSGQSIVFVEVKASLGKPRIESVRATQIMRIRRAAQVFLLEQGYSQDTMMRFDAIFVWGKPCQLTHIIDAF